MGTEVAERLAEFSVKTKFDDIPPETVEFVKGLTLKMVAAMVYGASMPMGKKITEFVKERKSPAEVGIVGSGCKGSLWEAVFADAMFAHGAELEDDRLEGGGTAWDITVFPITFPLAEKLHLSGKELLEISTVGLEVHSRTTIFFPQGHLGLTVVPGAMGPSTAAAKALGLNKNETMMALGLSMSATPVAYISFGTDAHFLESTFQALHGLVAAQMAKIGLIGNPDIVTFLSNLVGKDKVKPERFVEDLGRKWSLHSLWVKKYPCCFLMHRHLDSFFEVMRDENLTYDKIEKITTHISPKAVICDRAEPKSLGDIQFSFQHAFGAAMLDGDVNYDNIAEDKINDPRYKEARKKVEVAVHPDWISEFQFGTPARIDVKLKDGRVLSRERKYGIGSTEEPLSMAQFRQLFLKLMRGVLSEAKAKQIADSLISLEKLNANELQRLIGEIVFVTKGAG